MGHDQFEARTSKPQTKLKPMKLNQVCRKSLKKRKELAIIPNIFDTTME